MRLAEGYPRPKLLVGNHILRIHAVVGNQSHLPKSTSCREHKVAGQCCSWPAQRLSFFCYEDKAILHEKLVSLCEVASANQRNASARRNVFQCLNQRVRTQWISG